MSRGFKGFPTGGGGGGNMQALMKQAQKMQEELQKAQEESHHLTAEGSAGGGMVKVVVNGKHDIESVVINPEAVAKENTEMLQEMILVAVNQAMQKVREQVQQKIGAATGGLNIPGLF